MGYPSVEEISKNFPQQSIPLNVGKPTYTAIRAVHHPLQENVASVPKTLGGGHHGHLALVTNPVQYHTISEGAAFNPPRNPGPVPIPPRVFMAAAEMEALQMQHKADFATYHTCYNASKALKNQLLTLVNDNYITAIKEEHTSYTT
eukprot:14239174-Ditylum_brightwellii.AAC.1